MKLLILGRSALVIVSVFFLSFLAIHSQTVSKLNAPVMNTFSVSGLVIDESGVPVEGVRVLSMATDRSVGSRTATAGTDHNGRFVIENVNPGRNVVYAEKEDAGYPGVVNIAFNGKPAIAEISEKSPSAEVLVQLGKKCPRLTGKVVENQSRAPIKDAHVKTCLVDKPEVCFTTSINENGTFNILVPVEQSFTFTVSSPSHKEKTLTEPNNGLNGQNLFLKSGEERNVTVALDSK